MKIPWRKNVLWLMILAYAAVLLIFGGLVWKGGTTPAEGMDAADAYDVIKEPLMALIGGTLALAKDLVPFGNDDPVVQKSQAGTPPTEDDGAKEK